MRHLIKFTSIFALAIPGIADARTYASINDVLISTRCELAQIAKQMRDTNHNIASFQGKMTFKRVNSSFRSTGGNIGPFSRGLVSVEAGGSGQASATSTAEDQYGFVLVPGKPIPPVCNKLAIRLFNERMRAKSVAYWRIDGEAPALEKLGKHEMDLGSRTYSGSIEYKKSLSGKLTLNLILFKINIGGEASDTETTTYQFAFTFDENDPKPTTLKLPADLIPVRFGPVPK